MMANDASITEENVRIQGAGRMLEGVLAYHDDEQPRFGAIVAGPHPFLGGGMRNNVVGALLTSLAGDGAAALAFNYGGVGESEGGPADWPAVMSAFWKDGTFPEEHDWAEDCGAAIAKLREWCALPPVLVGYSFGCWTIVRNLASANARAVVLISPNPTRHGFEPLSQYPVPLLVVHSDNDFTCSAPDMATWFDSLREPKARTEIAAGEHFFRGRESDVARIVLEFLRGHDIARAQ